MPELCAYKLSITLVCRFHPARVPLSRPIRMKDSFTTSNFIPLPAKGISAARTRDNASGETVQAFTVESREVVKKIC